MDVDPVEQRAGDAFLLLGDSGMGAGTGFLTIAVIAARKGIFTIVIFFVLDEGQKGRF
jgi:hypothetical protein